MKISQKICRNCGSNNFNFIGYRPLDPFFGRYGLHIATTGTYRGSDRIQKYLGVKIESIFRKFFNKILKSSVMMAYGGCDNCHIISPWAEFTDITLHDFYTNYLTDTYKSERIKFQPAYAEISRLHGCKEEMLMRQEQHQIFIVPHLSKFKSLNNFSTLRGLDFGGGTGIIVPSASWLDMVSIDINDELLSSTTQDFNFVQILHVLEHVGDPRQTLHKAIQKLTTGGLLYIEVPHEMIDFENLSKEQASHPVCDEHINKYCEKSLEHLAKSLSLKVILCESGILKLLHFPYPLKIVRLLAIKG
jgi:hypothetical protein